ncbi:MAG: glycerophosphodiester phosphodiesterase family protein, partial [Propionibacteriaceae bacterium]|nr:glycerophosphodiester phosphodiesterase family protein [Propionibacteriaceae bacterium]
GHPVTAPTRTTLADELNSPLRDLIASRRPLIAVHRGSGAGSIAENTGPAVQAALAQGADVVEIDIVRSTDGEFFCFHDGYEPMHFGIQRRLFDLTAAEIRSLSYRWQITEPGAYPVQSFTDLLRDFPDTFFSVDRSWRWWPELLDLMTEDGDPSRLILKSEVTEDALRALAEHPTPFPYMPIVRDLDQVACVRAEDRINTVGLEPIAPSAAHPFVDDAFLDAQRADGMVLLANALNLANRIPLFAGFDGRAGACGAPPPPRRPQRLAASSMRPMAARISPPRGWNGATARAWERLLLKSASLVQYWLACSQVMGPEGSLARASSTMSAWAVSGEARVAAMAAVARPVVTERRVKRVMRLTMARPGPVGKWNGNLTGRLIVAAWPTSLPDAASSPPS